MTDNKINLQHLTTILSEKTGLAKKDTESFLREWFEVMGEAITEVGILKVKKLGTFKLVPIENRESIHVASGDRVLIPAHNKIIFTPDKELAELVNEPFSFFETTEIESDSLSDEQVQEPIDITENEDVIEIPEPTEKLPETKPEELPEPIKQEESIEQKAPVTISEPLESVKHKSLSPKHYLLIFAGILVLAVGVFFFHDSFSNKEKPALTQVAPVPSPKPAQEPVKEPLKEPEPVREQTQETLPVQKNELEKPKENPIVKESKPAEPVKITSTEKYRTVVSGERLTTIAQEEYGNKYFWVYIYEENRNVIANPDKIQPGLKLVIPPAQKYGIDKNDEKSLSEAKAISDGFKK
jgi:nucleoid DNA-binding protein